MKDIKSVKVAGKESPVEDFQKNAQAQIDNYRDAVAECKKILVDRKLRVFEQTRVANELIAMSMEDFANNVEDYINKKLDK